MKKRWLWFWARWLPARCREELLAENARLAAALAEQKAENARLRAYLEGMQAVLRARRGITIYNGKDAKG